MERQRVVHYARSRTAKVIRPVFTNYPASSTTTTSSEPSQAPLASIDSDFVIITKRRDETNMAPNLWGHVKANTPQTNFILQNLGEHSGIFETAENYGEQHDYSPPRTYLKLRASQNSSMNNASDKLHLPQCLPQGHTIKNNNKILNEASNGGRQLPVRVHDSQSTYFTKAASRAEMTYHTNGSYAEQKINGADNCMSGALSDHINGNTDDNIPNITNAKIIKDNVFVDSKMKPSVGTHDFPISGVISDHSSLNPQTRVSSSADIERVVVQHSSRIYSSGNGDVSDLDVKLNVNSKAMVNTGRSRTNDSLSSGLSEGNQHKTDGSHISPTVNQSSAGRVDQISAVDGPQGGEEMQSEVSGISPSDYTSDIRLASERIAQIYTKRLPHSRYSHHYCSIYVTSSPSSSLHKSPVKAQHDRVNFQSSLQRDVRRVNAVNQKNSHYNTFDIKHRNSLPTPHFNDVQHIRTCPTTHPSNFGQQRTSPTTHLNNVGHTRTLPTTHLSNVGHTRTSPTTHLNNVGHTRTSPTTHLNNVGHTRTSPTTHLNNVGHTRTSPTTHLNNVGHTRTLPPPNSDTVHHPERAPCWKRSSLRQATHGYSSISELTLSMENLDTTSSDINTSTNTCLTSGVEKPQRTHSVNVVDTNCADQYPTVELGGRYSNPSVDSSRSSLLDAGTTQLLSDDVDFHGSKRLSYKLATSDSFFDLPNTNGGYGFRSAVNNKYGHLSKSNSLCTDTRGRCIQRDYLADTSGSESGRDRDTWVSGQGIQPLPMFGTFDHEEELRSLKRRSFKLATSSLSDLTFLDDSVESGFSVDRQNVRTVDDLETGDFSRESAHKSMLWKTDGQPAREDSFSSGRLNSSFGSFYSCQSRDFQLSVDAPGTHPLLKYGPNQKRSSPALERSSFRDGVGSESSFSGDSSAYCTASDTSYPTPDGELGHIPYIDLPQPPSRMTLLAQRQKSSANRYQKTTQSRSSLSNVSAKASTQNVKPAKYYSQSGVFRCYGCGPKDKFSFQTQHRGRKHSARLESSRSRIYVNPDYVHGGQLDYRKRSRSAPASRSSSRQSEASARKLIPVKGQMYIEPGPRISKINSSVSAPSPSPSSATTFVDSQWLAMPRIPPSLGRPRRKLYAGFDSQPLPMDSFLSDSSSVYSTHSYSSWSTSRSATVESCSRTPDLLSKARSTSSIASSLITPTRPATHDEVFDFFTYTDKRSSVSENSHNLYLSRQNSYPDDSYKDVFYDITYSKESLESFLSDGTTVNADHDVSPEYSLGYEKPRLNSFSGSADLQNNKRSVLEDQKQSRQNNQLDIVYKGGSSNPEIKSLASLDNRKNQLKLTKGSALDNTGKPKFFTKQKCFSTKDIFDLVMSSDRSYKDIKGRSRSLERQAQKVCETILCLT